MASISSPLFILNGPNLNLLGLKSVAGEGVDTLDDVEAACRDHAADYGFEVVFRQTNLEGELIGWIQEAQSVADGVIINAAGYAGTSVAISESLRFLDIPVIEVSLDNPAKRGYAAPASLITPIAAGTVTGFGPNSYVLAISAIAQLMGRE